MADSIHTELKDTVFIITLDGPKANALTLAMVMQLQRAFREAAQQPEARTVLLRSAGDSFSGGQDIDEMMEAQSESYRTHLLETYNPLVKQIRQINLPVVAEIRGTVAGAALGLVLACDLRVAGEDARFIVGFLGIGLVPDSAVSLFLPALIGLGRATEAAFFNQPIGAHQALSWGMVNRVVAPDSLEISAFELAHMLTLGPTHAMGLAKREFNLAIYPNLDQVLDYEAHTQEIARSGAEHEEGRNAFIEKRKPKF